MVITTVKDINGSPHIAIPADLLEQIQLPIGSSVSINIEDMCPDMRYIQLVLNHLVLVLNYLWFD
ncbi:MAG: hypothetical protein ACKPE1_31545 [Dolichospermum sp.]